MEGKKIKKWWLISLIAVNFSSIIFIIFLGIQIGKLSLLERTFENELLLKKFPGILVSSIGSFFGSVFCSFILYRCAYRKPGTRLLTFFIVCTCISIPYSIYSMGGMSSLQALLIELKFSNELIVFVSNFKYFNLFSSIVLIGLLFFSFKLRKFNKRSQLNILNTIPEYQNVFQDIQSSSNSDELCLKYGESVRKYPQLAGHLKKIFKERNNQLKS